MRWPTLHVVTGLDLDHPGFPRPQWFSHRAEQSRKTCAALSAGTGNKTLEQLQSLLLLAKIYHCSHPAQLCSSSSSSASPVVSETSCDKRQEPLFEETGKTWSQFKSSSLYWRVSLLLESREVHLKKGFVCSPIQHLVYLTIFLVIIPIQTFPMRPLNLFILTQLGAFSHNNDHLFIRCVYTCGVGAVSLALSILAMRPPQVDLGA